MSRGLPNALLKALEAEGYEIVEVHERAPVAETPLSDYDRKLMARKGTIYFIRGQSAGLIKIGIAKSVEKRLKTLQSGSPVLLVVLATMPGTGLTERELHHRFAHLRRHGEWFEPGDDLLAFIAEIS